MKNPDIKLNKIFIIMIFLPFMILSGCIHINTNIVDMKPSAFKMKSSNYEMIGEAEGSSSNFKLLWFFPVTPRLDLKEAIDEAIGEKGGDNLIEVYVWKRREFWITGTIEELYVKGKVIRYIDDD